MEINIDIQPEIGPAWHEIVQECLKASGGISVSSQKRRRAIVSAHLEIQRLRDEVEQLRQQIWNEMSER